MIFDDRVCALGEGPLWHPERQELLWFDILSNTLLSKDRTWSFDEHASAAGWIDRDRLLIASETALFRFDLATGQREDLCALEADNPVTRSNDGRADPWGGFWIGTMGKAAEPDAGAIYRFYKGELRQLFAPIQIPNAICFSPDGTLAYFTDTNTQTVMAQRLSEPDGWPIGTPEVLLDLRGTPYRPDGSVCDADGNVWNAQWGVGRVAAYGPDGAFLHAVEVEGAIQSSCPAFGGPGLGTLYCTSATQGRDTDYLSEHPDLGKTFAFEGVGKGLPEHQIIL